MDLPKLGGSVRGDARSWLVKQFLDWGWKVLTGGAISAGLRAVIGWARGARGDELFDATLVAALLGAALVALVLVIVDVASHRFARHSREVPVAAEVPTGGPPSSFSVAVPAPAGAPATRFFVSHHGARWEDEGRRDPLGRPIMRGPLCLFHYERLTYIQEPLERIPKDDDFFGKGATGRLRCSVCDDALGAYSNCPLTCIGESREGARDLVEYITERMRAPGKPPVGDPCQLVAFGDPEDLCEDGTATRWAVPVAGLFGCFETCTAFLLVDGVERQGFWRGSDGKPTQGMNLDSRKRPAILPVAIRPNRFDLTNTEDLPIGVARLMNGAFYGKDRTRKFDLNPGTHRIELRILWSEFEWRSPPYILTVPPVDEIVNLHFTFKRLD